jgi:hypothetical protein
MTDSLCNKSEKEVHDRIICFRVQQFPDWRIESDSLEIRLNAVLGRN